LLLLLLLYTTMTLSLLVFFGQAPSTGPRPRSCRSHRTSTTVWPTYPSLPAS
jgi:hypothetical protein